MFIPHPTDCNFRAANPKRFHSSFIYLTFQYYETFSLKINVSNVTFQYYETFSLKINVSVRSVIVITLIVVEE